MAVLKRSTGHSHLARPPTGENDARCLTRKSAIRLPQVSDLLANWHVVSGHVCSFVSSRIFLFWDVGGGNLLLCAVILFCACILNQKE